MIVNSVKTEYYKCYKCYKIVNISVFPSTNCFVSWTDGKILSSDFAAFGFGVCGKCDELIEVGRLEYVNTITYHYNSDTNSVDISDDRRPDECSYWYSVRKMNEYASEPLKYPTYQCYLLHINKSCMDSKLYERNVRLQLWRSGNDRRRFMPEWEGGGHYLNYGLLCDGDKKPTEFLEVEDIEKLRVASEEEVANARRLMQLQIELMNDTDFVASTCRELGHQPLETQAFSAVFKSWFMVQAELHRQFAEFSQAIEYLDILSGSLQRREPKGYVGVDYDMAVKHLRALCNNGVSELVSFQE